MKHDPALSPRIFAKAISVWLVTLPATKKAASNWLLLLEKLHVHQRRSSSSRGLSPPETGRLLQQRPRISGLFDRPIVNLPLLFTLCFYFFFSPFSTVFPPVCGAAIDLMLWGAHSVRSCAPSCQCCHANWGWIPTRSVIIERHTFTLPLFLIPTVSISVLLTSCLQYIL